MQTVRELRAQLGWSQARFARHVCASIRSVIKWETGRGQPDASHRKLILNLARWHGLRTWHEQSSPTHRYNDDKMRKYEQKPGHVWLDWHGQKRASFYGHRARYARIKADIEAGRAFGQPVIALLDAAPDLDLT